MGAMILFATGSGDFNIRMRSIAKHKGWKLNRYGLYDRITEEVILESPNEKDFFDKIGAGWIEPKNRG